MSPALRSAIEELRYAIARSSITIGGYRISRAFVELEAVILREDMLAAGRSETPPEGAEDRCVDAVTDAIEGRR